MICLDDNTRLLYIEPKCRMPASPGVKDDLVYGMRLLFGRAKRCSFNLGVHTCACGVESEASDYMLPGDHIDHAPSVRGGLKGGRITNSLCVHYLVYHRDEVPESELEKLRDELNHFQEPERLRQQIHSALGAPKEVLCPDGK